MPSTFDPLLRLELQAVGENATTWGVKTNNNLSLLGDAIAGYLNINVAGSGNYTLTTANAAQDESRRAFLAFTGTLTGNRTIIIPPVAKVYTIRNATAGAFTLTVKTATGNSLVINRNDTVVVACDGLDVFSASPSIPAGVITMWSGSIASIPSGWALCDGTNGTPNLRDRFVVGAGSIYAVNATGGSLSGTTGAGGEHNHGGITTIDALTEAQMPAHSHGGSTSAAGAHDHAMGNALAQDTSQGSINLLDFGVGNIGIRIITNAVGDHTHTFFTDTRGSSQGHGHGIFGSGTHTHTFTATPPYYALAYIMKL